MPRRFVAALAAALALAGPAEAQSDLATLVADRVTVAGEGAITAEGNVEVFYQGVRLTAPRVRYERAGERIVIDGPITLVDGETVRVLADAAELDADLRNGVLLGAQMVLDRELQIASPRIDRVEGRFVRLTDAVATACRVCAGNPTPLWEIRAREVIHDREAGQLYFEGAQFRLAGVPLAWLPRFRMPDPTIERATGLLPPNLRTSTLLGTGLRLPYFVVLGPHADLTLTPWLSDITSTLEARYRQQFTFGEVTLDTAASRDSLTDETRAYLFANASAVLPGRFRLSGDIELVSDPAYLSDYGFSDKDRLDSALALERTQVDEDILLRGTVFRTLRGPELAIKDEVAGRLLEGRYERALPSGAPGGQVWLRFDTTALVRPSTRDVAGRDVTRLGAALDWENGAVFGPGLVATLRAGLSADAYAIDDDSSFRAQVLRATPHATLDLRWPLGRKTARAHHLIEPALTLAWSDTTGGRVPDEDSALVEFDEGNLFGLSRFPGADRTETGPRAALALSYTRAEAGGWSLGATAGRLFWIDDPGIDAISAGLTGTQSDWLVSFGLDYRDRLSLQSRNLLDDDALTRSENRLVWANERARIGAVHTYLTADAADGRDRPIAEIALTAGLNITDAWSAGTFWRYNATENRPVDGVLDLRYQTECVRLNVSLSRNYAASATVTPATEFAFGVAFGGYGDSRGNRRSCRS